MITFVAMSGARLGDQQFPLRHERSRLDQDVVHRGRYVHEPEFEPQPGGPWAREDL
jgi:hypothetical protein